jgi:Holliday junction resolvase
MKNNKQIGTEFEKAIVDLLSKQGYWVHFIVPDARGAQPFDIIAVKDGMAVAMDCKTCKDRYFRMSRLEENQIMAFEKWMRCGNTHPFLAVEHGDIIRFVDYVELKLRGKVDLEDGKKGM